MFVLGALVWLFCFPKSKADHLIAISYQRREAKFNPQVIHM